MKDETRPVAATEPHPLDDPNDFEFGKPDVIDKSRTAANKPLLRWSVIVAAVAFVVIFVTSVMGNNAPFNSLFQRACSTISGMAAMVMLGACAGILFAYRLPHIDVDELSHRMKSGAIGAKGWLANGLVTLTLLNMILVIVAWVGAFLLGDVVGWMYALGLVIFTICFTGIAATMVVTHTGYLRGYAIGVLTVLFPVCFGALAVSFFYAPYLSGARFGGGAPAMDAGIIASLMAITTACGVGLICGCYVAAVDWVRGRKSSFSAGEAKQAEL